MSAAVWVSEFEGVEGSYYAELPGSEWVWELRVYDDRDGSFSLTREDRIRAVMWEVWRRGVPSFTPAARGFAVTTEEAQAAAERYVSRMEADADA